MTTIKDRQINCCLTFKVVSEPTAQKSVPSSTLHYKEPAAAFSFHIQPKAATSLQNQLKAKSFSRNQPKVVSLSQNLPKPISSLQNDLVGASASRSQPLEASSSQKKTNPFRLAEKVSCCFFHATRNMKIGLTKKKEKTEAIWKDVSVVESYDYKYIFVSCFLSFMYRFRH